MRLHSRQFARQTDGRAESNHDANDDEALLILHGLLGSSANWQSIAKRFAQKRPVYALDLRNHGKSPWSDDMTYAAMAQDIADFIASLDHQRITVLGHSMGGKVAMHFALRQAMHLHKLIIADIAPVQYSQDNSRSHIALIDAMLSIDLSLLQNRSQADEQLKPNVPNAAIRAFLLHNLKFNNEDKTWAWQVNLVALKTNMQHITAFEIAQETPFQQNCLMLYGKHSEYVNAKYFDKIGQLFPAVQYAALDAGHWLHAEQSQAFVTRCEQFLAQ